eukprot:11162790-Lingulodinium_polyedra.AAC.1
METFGLDVIGRPVLQQRGQTRPNVVLHRSKAVCSSLMTCSRAPQLTPNRSSAKSLSNMASVPPETTAATL